MTDDDEVTSLIKERLKKSLFDALDEGLAEAVKAKLRSTDVRAVIDCAFQWVEEHAAAISTIAPKEYRLHKPTASFADRRDEEPDFLKDLSKV